MNYHMPPEPGPGHRAEYDLAVNEGEGWLLGGIAPPAKLNQRLARIASRWSIPLGALPTCRFCGCRMRVAQERAEAVSVPELGVPCVRGYTLQCCPRCAHWKFWAVEEQCMDHPRCVLAVGLEARFSSKIPPGCDVELAKALTRRPAEWSRVNSRALEQLVAEVFRRNFAPCEVQHVGRSGDGGKDVVYIAGGTEKWLIQVKGHRNPLKPEPVTTIRSLVGTLVDEGVPRGIVVTTADAFSRDAYAAVRRYDARGYRIRLFDQGLLRELIGPLVPRRPWEALFRVPDFMRLGEDVRGHAERALLPNQLGLFE